MNMNYENVKKAFSKLFTAELLLILANVLGSFIKNLSWLMYVAVVLIIVAFVMNLVGLKQMSNDNIEYRHAYVLTLAGILIVVISAIGATCTETGTMANNLFNGCLNDGNNIFEFLIGYSVIKGSIDVANGAGKADLANYAKKTLTLYTVAFAISILLEIGVTTDLTNLTVSAIFLVVGIVALVLALVAQIKYFIFLKKMYSEL